jgi:hypothetical protein
MEKKIITKEMRAMLNAPLPSEALKQHPTKAFLTTIKPIYVIERLNDVFGVGAWICKSIELKTDISEGQIVVKGILEIPEYGIYLEQYGGNDNGGEDKKGFDLGDAFKGAFTDALTKIASYLEIGIDVHKGKSSSKSNSYSKPQEPTYQKTEPKKETTQLKVVAPAIDKFEKIEAKLKATTDFTEYMNYVTKCLSYDASLSDSKVFTDLVEKYKPGAPSAEPKQTNLTDYEELLNQHNKGKTEDYISFLAKMQRENPELERDLEWEFAVQKCTPRSKRAG